MAKKDTRVDDCIAKSAAFSQPIFFFFNDTAPTEIYTSVHTLSLHDALPISRPRATERQRNVVAGLGNPAAAGHDSGARGPRSSARLCGRGAVSWGGCPLRVSVRSRRRRHTRHARRRGSAAADRLGPRAAYGDVVAPILGAGLGFPLGGDGAGSWVTRADELSTGMDHRHDASAPGFTSAWRDSPTDERADHREDVPRPLAEAAGEVREPARAVRDVLLHSMAI